MNRINQLSSYTHPPTGNGLNCFYSFFLHRNLPQVYYYLDTNEKKPKELKIPNCPEPCSLSQFGDAIRDLLVYDIAAACGCGTIDAQISKPTDIFH